MEHKCFTVAPSSCNLNCLLAKLKIHSWHLRAAVRVQNTAPLSELTGGLMQRGKKERGRWEERDKRRRVEVMEAAVQSLRENRKGRQTDITENLCRHLLIWRWISPLCCRRRYHPNPYFCVQLNCQVMCCCDWSFLSEVRPKQRGIVIFKTKGNTEGVKHLQ